MKKIAISDIPDKILEIIDKVIPCGEIKEAEKGIIY